MSDIVHSHAEHVEKKEKSFARQYNVMQTSLHGGFNGKPSPPSPDCNPEEDICSEADSDAADHSYLPPRWLLCLGMMMLIISCHLLSLDMFCNATCLVSISHMGIMQSHLF